MEDQKLVELDIHRSDRMSFIKFGFEKFNGDNGFTLWRIKMKVLMVLHQGQA